jgi:MFS family permease
VLINRNYARLFVGQSVSVIGDEVFDTTLLLWVGIVLLAGKPYAPLVSSAVLILTSLVIVLLGPVAGVFVDRWNKRRILLRADAIRAVLIGLLVLVAAFPSVLPLPMTLAAIAVVVALATAAAQFFNPARTIVVNDVVPAESLGRAVGYGQTSGALASVIGPPLAAPLLVGVGVPWAIAVNAVTFVVSYLAIRSVRFGSAPGKSTVDDAGPAPAAIEVSPTATEEVTPPAGKTSVRREFLEGLRFIGRQRLVLASLVTAVVINLGAGSVSALTVYFVAEDLHADPAWFGLLGGAFGVGAVVGALAGGVLGDRWGHIRVVTAGLIVSGVFVVAYSRSGSVWVAAGFLAGFGLCVGALNSALVPVILHAVPRELQGRVFAVIGPANRLGGIVSIAIASALVSTVLRGLDVTVAGVHLGRIDSVFGVAGLIVIGAGVYFGLAARERRPSLASSS